MTVAMAYLTLFLTHITNMALMREFLQFLVQGKYDGRSVINTVLYSIASSDVKVSCLHGVVNCVLGKLLDGSKCMHVLRCAYTVLCFQHNNF